MPNYVRPLSLAVSLAFASATFAAIPEKPAAKPAAKPATKAAAPAATPNSANELEVGHNLSPAGATRLQAVIDRFNKETGGSMKLVLSLIHISEPARPY